jgi:hypothetical protein
MRAATVKQRRRLVDGRLFVQVACPHCSHRHWVAEAATGECPRRPATTFTITDPHERRTP